jgi:glutathione S-transferase
VRRADVYCDSEVILAELEARQPKPQVVHPGDWAMNDAADGPWFQATVVVVFAGIGDAVPKEFIADREKLSGRPFDTSGMKAALPYMREQWRKHAEALESKLGDNDFLGGSSPSLADVAAYMNVWWLGGAARETAAELLDGLPKTQAWRARIRAIGHGQRGEMAPAEALDAARAAEPAPPPKHEANPEGLSPGAAVTVSADDYGRDPIAGSLVATTADRIVIARDAGDLGALHLHFPRTGYILAAA